MPLVGKWLVFIDWTIISSCLVDGFVHPLNNLGLVIIQDAQLSVSGNGFYLPPIRVLVRK